MSIRKFLTLILPFSALLLFGVLVIPFIRGHTSAEMTAMLSTPEASGNCAAICTSQSSLQFNNVQNKLGEEDQEPDPEPAEPYYLAFVGIGWTTAVTVTAAYLLKYLRWRPPDIFSLYSYYRI